jgi:hypothetical protein
VVAQAGVGAQPEQVQGQLLLTLAGGDVQRGLPWLLGGDVGAAHGVDVEAEPGQEPDRAGPPLGRRPDDQRRAGRPDLAGQAGAGGPQLVEGGLVRGQGGGDETLPRVEVGRVGAPGDQEADEIGMSGGGRALGGSGPVGERCDEVGAVLGEQPDPFGHAVGDGPGQLPAHQLLRGVQGGTETGSPGAAVAAAEAGLEEQLQVIVARLEHPVVQRLAVVGVGAGLEQQAGQGQGVRVARLAPRAQLALAEHAGQDGERGGQAVPQVAGVRVGARVEQQPGAGEHGVRADGGVVAGVGQVEQRLAAERAARPGGAPRVRGQVRAQPGHVRRRGRGADAGPRDLRIAGEDLTGLRPPLRLVVFVGEAAEAEELTGRAVRRHPSGEAAVPLDDFDVTAQPGPAREVIPAGHDELGRAQREPRGRRGVRGAGGVAPRRLGERVRVTLADRALQVSGLVTELLEAGFGGQVGHDGSFRAPAVRVASRKE